MYTTITYSCMRTLSCIVEGRGTGMLYWGTGVFSCTNLLSLCSTCQSCMQSTNMPMDQVAWCALMSVASHASYLPLNYPHRSRWVQTGEWVNRYQREKGRKEKGEPHIHTFQRSSPSPLHQATLARHDNLLTHSFSGTVCHTTRPDTL